MAFSDEEYRRRFNLVMRGVEACAYDALIAFESAVLPGHVVYLTGYQSKLGAHTWSAFATVPSGAKYRLITNTPFDDHHSMSWVEDVQVTGDIAGACKGVIPADSLRIGVAGWRALPTWAYLDLCKTFPQANFEDASDVVLAVRQIKSPEELGVVRRTMEITDLGGQAFLDSIVPGINELEIAGRIAHAMRSNGSDDFRYGLQVSSGSRTRQLVAFPVDRLLQVGDEVQLDCGAVYRGYSGDFSRAGVVGGRPAGARREMLEVTHEMYWACVDRMKPGVLASQVAEACAAVANRRGWGDYLFHSPNVRPGFCGHGIGCCYHEWPWLDLSTHAPLEPGMVIAIEALLQGELGAVKLEDAVLISADGNERLSRHPIRIWE